jgi:hypothetical protein
MSFPILNKNVVSVTQAAHGFVVGDWVYLGSSGAYVKTTASLAVSADSV